MPATFPSHAAAVLPLKLWRPRWFDGVALVIGSTAPDLGYALIPFHLYASTHAWLSLLWWSLPVTVALSVLARWSAPVAAAHLPDIAGLRDYGVLGSSRPRWWITISSAVLGAATHVLWDTFTHAYAPRPLHGMSIAGLPWWHLLQYVSTVVGGLVAVALLGVIGRRRLLVAWHGPAPDAPRRPALFWPPVSAVIAAGLVLSALWPQPVHIAFAGGLLVLGLASLAGSAAVRWGQ
ncbi:DUF4184 family protein [Hamadaea tsunoensis]|uniref:DUF4184 family protein n=1 Tax=Hamadaea tsunoensis TaxID=53368 RepID=UPI0004131EA9|nr:DUF4184 family protein [Hamadaea tsunoensis]